ncbi:MAG: protein phosphatase CheZ [Paludibacterium sp.]|uniref:protein phosphatase CheZ n=1 Tax=Paludibacterium sp. TaxID=1917523 RepID=UPI0025F5BC63|nr:protein phosphatase CheZ [Paludibacterium sp.]MBV8046347.1 protein phosphatase CheZ [Paludibacterium sp.]MBV8649537.1 protein phosphatase CheZ [Paludibacterium sp.]
MTTQKQQQQAVFQQLGQMTRTLHATLQGIGGDGELTRAVEAMPDARERLAYVLSMTEQAVSRVLNAVDAMTPLLDRRQSEAQTLLASWARVSGMRRDTSDYRRTLQETRDFLQRSEQESETHKAHLMEIVMAQEFQDLTGQVIKRVVEVAGKMESELLTLLQQTQPATGGKKKADGLLNGPAMPSDIAGQQALSSQAEVDKFLDDLGF